MRGAGGNGAQARAGRAAPVPEVQARGAALPRDAGSAAGDAGPDEGPLGGVTPDRAIDNSLARLHQALAAREQAADAGETLAARHARQAVVARDIGRILLSVYGNPRACELADYVREPATTARIALDSHKRRVLWGQTAAESVTNAKKGAAK